jgi:acetyltransferase-like isoleucine patch superfamily enzyme
MIIRALIFASRRLRWQLGSLWAKAVLRSYGVEYGHGLKISSAPVVRRRSEGKIVLGNNVVICNHLAENPAGINHPTVLAADRPGAKITIGNHVRMSGATIYAWQSIEIHEGVCLGADCCIYDTDFHPLEPHHRRTNSQPHTAAAAVVIEHDAWIGARAMVLKGVRIGSCAVVGAGAIVTSDVPSGAIVAGVPARVVGWVEGFQRREAA